MSKKLYLAILLLGLALSTHGTGLLKEATGLRAIDGDTIMVEFEGKKEGVRYVSVNTPGLDDCLGEEAKSASDELIRGRAIWLKLDIQDGGSRRDRNGRLLAWVFLEPLQTPSASVVVLLVSQGLARLDVRDPNDTEIRGGKDFDVQDADWVIAAQTEAAKARRGWWGECDPYRDANMMIAAIKQWTDETVYIVNRGAEPIDLADGWSLKDPKHELIFAEFLTEECLLPPGGILRVHSGPVCKGLKGPQTPCNQPAIDWCWTGSTVWNQDEDEARLRRSQETVYHYSYPLRDWD